MRVAIYARVSTKDQDNSLQIRELREYVERRGWTVACIYQDQMSGAKVNRPGLTALISDARLRRFDAVAVWKLDRFGRSLVHCISTLHELQSLGIRFIGISQGIDTDESNPGAKLLMHILAAVAQFERELIRERVCVGMRHARARGAQIGRPRRVFDRQKAIELRENGESYPAIAQALGVSISTVVRTCGKKVLA